MLAAKRSGIQTVLLCAENKPNVEEIPAAYRKGLRFRYFEQMGDLTRYALNLRK
jgi:ATP-dependent Lon protease